MKIKWFQVEATTKCNAWCPGCARNQEGFGLVPDLIIEDLDSTVFEGILKQISALEVIDFCGTYGDAIAASNIETLTDIAKQYAKKIIVRTNGSLRNTQWWESYAEKLKGHDHEVWFCLDGLADTHSIYRQGTDFNTIIANATAFINSGGNAVWQFIPWKHNEHQVAQCIKLSQKLKFRRFEFIRDVRRNFNAKHYRTGEVIEILPWTKNTSFSRFEKTPTKVLPENCRHLQEDSLYLNANGKISPCCFFNTVRCVDSLSDLPDIRSELATPKAVCLKFCGS